MSIPPEPPSPDPPEPERHVTPDGKPPGRVATRLKSEKAQGALVALLVILLLSVAFGAQAPIIGLTVAPVVAFASVVVGSLLAISKHYRQFASGCLITSAILLIVTGGVCVSFWSQL